MGNPTRRHGFLSISSPDRRPPRQRHTVQTAHPHLQSMSLLIFTCRVVSAALTSHAHCAAYPKHPLKQDIDYWSHMQHTSVAAHAAETLAHLRQRLSRTMCSPLLCKGACTSPRRIPVSVRHPVSCKLCLVPSRTEQQREVLKAIPRYAVSRWAMP
ncbi:uncharacterized protein LY79DRAFT_548028 [Colletotrichum navitas]|uniref:Uncharacterized protein n=1 Tax=Colletotrichum navitas TaxID=681940 RepID=A0AAD8Q4T2_9PEZI|nr:uncharacterized protein LY79DRAFT_548028 [Colletotrichum navitas]KAK1595077.1 hypothetical protein LY79DRAFT_548028 [Colletotrichum navitas]